MNNKIPAYLYEKSNTIRLILLTAFFALVFIYAFEPFGSRDWFKDKETGLRISNFKYFFFSSLIILTGMLVVVVSRIIMLHHTKKHKISYWLFGLWVLAEIISMSLFFALFSKYIPEEGMHKEFIDIFRQSTVNTSLVLLLPYSILWLYFSWREKSIILEKLAEDKTVPEMHKKNLIGFPDEKGELKISIVLENLLYVESSDNYTTIHYLNKSKLSNFLIRNTLKWMDENITKETPLVRCHRSFLVNLDKVKVLRKTKDGIFLELEALNTPDIPVSKTYYDKVMAKFSKYSV